MGIEINKTRFTAGDYTAFAHRLEENLAALYQLAEDPGFGRGPASVGAELEMYIVDAQGVPLYANREIQQAADDAQLTLELNRYNLEYNLSHYAITDAPFAATEGEILEKLQHIRGVAAGMGGRIVPIGILPTLRQSDFGPHCITDRKRYHALVSQLIQRRGGEFKIDINGQGPA